jgi:exosortase/archaeosortase family protein
MSWRRRWTGMLTSIGLAYLLNLARVVTLFFVYRHERSWFEFLHTVAAPLAVVALAALFFQLWLTIVDARTAPTP